MPVEIGKDGLMGGATLFEVVHGIAQTNARALTAALTAMTNSAGGTAGISVATSATAFANVAATGSDLADKTTTEAAYNTVKDGLLEVATEVNEQLTALGLPTITYNGGGTAADGTLGAVTVSVTGASTGVQATQLNTMRDALNVSLVALAAKVNRVCRAVGLDELSITNSESVAAATTVAAITVSGGTAADPGVTKAVVDADLAVWRNNLTSLAAKLVSSATAAAPQVVAN